MVTPEKTLFDESVDFVALPMFDGELGVLPGRTPLIGRLGYGELRTRVGDVARRYFLDGGFAQIRDDVITILTNRAIPVEEIDTTKTKEELEHAQIQRVASDLEFAEKSKAVARSRAMLRVGKHKG